MPRESEGGYLARPEPSGLADVVEIVLDRGVVVDAYVRVSLVGIELLTLDARVVVASVDTYLRFAEATLRLDLWERGGDSLLDLATEGAGEMVEKVAESVTEHKVEDVVERAEEVVPVPVKKIARATAGTVGQVAEAAADALEDGPGATGRR